MTYYSVALGKGQGNVFFQLLFCILIGLYGIDSRKEIPVLNDIQIERRYYCLYGKFAVCHARPLETDFGNFLLTYRKNKNSEKPAPAQGIPRLDPIATR